jgi:ActR/RegA family two-component response regulator
MKPAVAHAAGGSSGLRVDPAASRYSRILMNAPTRFLLIVEDHVQTTKGLRRLVEARGFQALTASSLAEARAAAEKHDIGFLISDLGLPDGNGGDLMKEFHERFGISGVALTGYGMDADVAHAREMGFVLHLTKPIQIGDFEKALVIAKAELAKPRPAKK